MSFARIRRRIERLEAVVEPELPLQDRVFRILEAFLETANDEETHEVMAAIDAVCAARAARTPPVADPAQVPPGDEHQDMLPEPPSPGESPAEPPPPPPPPAMTPQLAWIEEHVRWRPRGEPDPYEWDEVNNRPIIRKPLPPNRVETEYDPLWPE